MSENPDSAAMHTVEVIGIRLEDNGNAQILMLQELGGEQRKVDIWIGAVEAAAIAYAEQGLVPPRPLTHDLILNILNTVSVGVTHVRITGIEGGTFIAEMMLSTGQAVSCRPSDAVAVAIRADVPVLVSESVLELAGDRSTAPKVAAPEDDIEAFREFLEHLNPEDFENPA